MVLPLMIAGELLCLIALVCAAVIFVHAFRRSVGTGVMVALLPFYVFFYAFSQFEHRRKGWVIAGFCGGLFAGVVLLQLGLSSTAPQLGAGL